MTNLKFIKTLTSAAALSAMVYTQALGADTGSCGTNCNYIYNPTTKALTYLAIDSSKEAIISTSSYYYGLSGEVYDVTVSEGITAIKLAKGSYAEALYHSSGLGRNVGTLTLPKSLSTLESGSIGSAQFKTIIINSENLNFEKGSLYFYTTRPDTSIVLSADSNVTFDEELMHHQNNGGWYVPNSLNISCKGNPDICLAKFGNALSHMSGTITADYYRETDADGNVILEYHDTGYYTYDSEGNITGRYNLSGTEQYDSDGNVIAKYDENSNLLSYLVYADDGSVYTYDINNKIIGAKKTSPFTPAEAAALVRKGNHNNVTLTFK